MKQHITLEQWKELSGDFQEELLMRLSLEGLVWEQLNIGKMIEFLREHTVITIYMSTLIIGKAETRIDYDDLCDALWEAVKEVLEQNDKE